MIVFRETGLVDVSGNILTDSQFLSSVKVILNYKTVSVDFHYREMTIRLEIDIN
jgi:hypothetical protein